MICFPNAKINLGLQIIGKRTDGFHNLASIFYPVAWCDALEMVVADEFEFSQSGIFIQGNSEDNLCVKVYRSLKQKFDLPNVKMHLHKNISIGAGLGGGSADGAFAMKLLNDLFDLKLSNGEMQELVKPFGSDCAFFIENVPTLAVNKGDEFERIDFSLKGKYLVLIYPELFISTKEAYSGVQPQMPSTDLNIVAMPIENWKGHLLNDFEKHLLIAHPQLLEIKIKLYELGGIYASMSGSGSTMYGIFENEIDLVSHFPANYRIWQGWAEKK